MRNINEVVEKVKNALPKNHKTRQSLENLQKWEFPYIAPENIGEAWRRFTYLLSEELPDPESKKAPKYAIQISKIMKGIE